MEYEIVFHDNSELEDFMAERGIELVTVVEVKHSDVIGTINAGYPGLKFKNTQDKIEFILKFN